MAARNRDHVKDMPNPAIRHALTPSRQADGDAWRAPLTGAPFYTACTHHIPQRSRLRREFVPASPIWCHPRSNDSRRLDRRGELLLRVVLLARLRDLRPRIPDAVGVLAPARPGDHPGNDPARYGHSADRESRAAQQGRGIPGLPAPGLEVHSAPAQDRHVSEPVSSGSSIPASAHLRISERTCPLGFTMTTTRSIASVSRRSPRITSTAPAYRPA